MTDMQHESPWSKRADELFEKEGMYCDYAAWLEWMDNALIEADFGHALDSLPPLADVQIYSLFNQAMQMAANTSREPTKQESP